MEREQNVYRVFGWSFETNSEVQLVLVAENETFIPQFLANKKIEPKAVEFLKNLHRDDKISIVHFEATRSSH